MKKKGEKVEVAFSILNKHIFLIFWNKTFLFVSYKKCIGNIFLYFVLRCQM